MKYLTQDQVVRLHQALIETSGGSLGIRDEGMLNSALKTPLQTYLRAFFRICQSLPNLQSLPFILPFEPYFPTPQDGCKVGAPFNDSPH